MNQKQVAVVIPVYRSSLAPDEEIAINHLRHFLGSIDQIVVGPESLILQDKYLQSLRQVRFCDDAFAGAQNYNRLMLSPEFYRKFSDYEYILIHQLDALIFSDRLSEWCSKGWDYIGAPWFQGFGDDTVQGLWATGNGGLSLRRVRKFLEVLNSRKRSPAGATRFSFASPRVQRWFLRLKDFAYACGYKSTVGYVVKNYTWNEDGFWAFKARHFADGFAVPAPEEALPFAFECAPRYCYEMNGRRLPFGCHAWNKTDPEFWRPFLLPGRDHEMRHDACVL